VEHARAALAPVLAGLAALPAPVLPGDLALAVGVTVRSVFSDPSDWVSVKEQYLAAAPPVLDVTSTEPSATQVVYRGTVTLPLWLNDPALTEITRDEGGAPVALGTDDVPFVFRVPVGAPTPMPIVIYQHGNPGSPNEVLSSRQTFLLEEGYAVVGIQDLQNRRFGEDIANQTTQIIGRLGFQNGQALTNFQTHADMMGLLRAIQGMGVAGNFPEVDPDRILFKGISFGAHDSLGFLPFAPEILAAASYVGSGRLYHANLHQIDYSDLLTGVIDALPGARPRDVIAGFAALQIEQDRDDPYLMARYLYREPLAIEGLSDTTPPSLLWIEGIGDSLVPNFATRATAVELGLPTLPPVAVSSPVLTEVAAPVASNIAPGVTGAHAQYDPATTESCLDAGQAEGHFCAQISSEAEAQVEHLFETALEGAPEIVRTLP
jgi:dienelactone hydrolase